MGGAVDLGFTPAVLTPGYHMPPWRAPILLSLNRSSDGRLGSPSVLSRKFVAEVGEASALLARRDDEGLASALIRGGATPPAAWRAAEFGDELPTQDTRPEHQNRPDMDP